MDENQDDVAGHYGLGGLRSRIETALASRSSDAPLSEEDISGAAEFHIGGRAASLRLVEQLDLSADSAAKVLDLGSGLGGTARLIAAKTGARVEGLDLTPEFVEVASWLSELTGFAERTSFRVGSAAEPLPWAGHFDAATVLHVGMNIKDKAALAHAVHEALRPSGRFVIYDIMAGPAGADDLAFPVPWANSPATSHVASADEYSTALTGAGFEVVSVEDLTEWATSTLAAAAPPSALNLGLVMGPETPAKVANMRANMAAGRIAPTLIVAHRR